MVDVHSMSGQEHEVAFVGVSRARGGRHGIEGLCTLGNSLRVNGGVHGIMYALVRMPISQKEVNQLGGVHCTWNHILLGVGDVKEELAKIAAKHERVVVLSDSQLIEGSMNPVLACNGRCSLAGAHSFVLHNTSDFSWPSRDKESGTNYEIVWSVARNGTSMRGAEAAGTGIVDFDVDSMWLPWHWQSGTLDGVYAMWRRRAPRQSPDVTVICILAIHVIGLISVSPDTFRTESFLVGRRRGGIESMTRAERACYMFFWGYFTEDGPTSEAAKAELTVREAVISLITSFLHINVVLCYFSFSWFEELSSIQYDVAFFVLIASCASWGAALSLLCARALGYYHVSTIHFWRFYFGFACVACIYPLMLKLLTGTEWFDHYSFSPAYALTVSICFMPMWTAITSVIQLDHILSITRA